MLVNMHTVLSDRDRIAYLASDASAEENLHPFVTLLASRAITSQDQNVAVNHRAVTVSDRTAYTVWELHCCTGKL